MAKKENDGKREQAPLERIVLSNWYSIETLIDVLVEKGLVTKEEVLKRWRVNAKPSTGVPGMGPLGAFPICTL